MTCYNPIQIQLLNPILGTFLLFVHSDFELTSYSLPLLQIHLYFSSWQW